MKNLALIILLSFGLNSYSQPCDLSEDCKALVLKTYHYQDYYPTLSGETDMLCEYFDTVLVNRNSDNITNEFTKEAEALLYLFYENGACKHDGSPDSRRLKMKRSLCFASLALSTELDKSMAFIEYAKYSLVGKEVVFKDEMLANQYLGLLMIEMMFHIEGNTVSQDYLNSLEICLIENSKYVKSSHYDDARAIVRKCKGIVKKEETPELPSSIDIQRLPF